MAEKRFLVDLNLSGNKAKNFRLEDYTTEASTSSNFAGRLIHTTDGTDRIKLYDGSAWKTVAYTDDVPSVSISLTTPDIFTVSGSPAAYNGTLDFQFNAQSANAVLAGPGTGANAVPTFRSLVAADIPSLTSAKISDFQEAVEDVAAGLITSATHNGVSVSYTDNGSSAGTLAITNTGVVSLAGTSNEVEVTNTGTAYTVGLPDDVTIGRDLIVTRNLTVNGDVTTLNTATLNIEDNVFVLNSNFTGAATLNAGIEIERGDYANTSLFWNETDNNWWVSYYIDSATSGVPSAQIARKVVRTTTGTTHTITHNLNTEDVTVNCYLAGEQIEAAIVITNTNTVTVTTNASITDLKTVVVG